MTSYRRPAKSTNEAEEEVMKRALVIAFVAIVCTFPLSAQQPDPVGIVAHVLDLSEDQITAWAEILHAREAAIQPLAQRAQAAQQQIGQALESSNPDAATVGRALIELKGLQIQIGAANAQAAKEFEQLLTPDQRDRLNAVRSAAQACPIIPAFEATGLLGAPHAP